MIIVGVSASPPVMSAMALAATLGREFGYDLIEQVAGRPPEELRLGLDRLANETGLIGYAE
jgi:hypothetical protein